MGAAPAAQAAAAITGRFPMAVVDLVTRELWARFGTTMPGMWWKAEVIAAAATRVPVDGQLGREHLIP